MAADPVRERYDAFFSTDFMPTIRHQQAQGAEERAAYAAEYSARQLGLINKNIERLVQILERSRE